MLRRKQQRSSSRGSTSWGVGRTDGSVICCPCCCSPAGSSSGALSLAGGISSAPAGAPVTHDERPTSSACVDVEAENDAALMMVVVVRRAP